MTLFDSATRKLTVPTLLLLMTVSGCIHRPYAQPAGNLIGSCEGTMRFTSGGRSHFILKAYHLPEAAHDNLRLYFMLRGKTGHLPVADIDYEDGTLRIVAGSNSLRVFQGSITGNPLKFKGSLKGFEGAFTFDIKEFLDE